MTVIVKPGDSLWKIARLVLGRGTLWRRLRVVGREAPIINRQWPRNHPQYGKGLMQVVIIYPGERIEVR